MAGACVPGGPSPAPAGGPQDDLLYLRPRIIEFPMDESLALAGLGLEHKLAALLLAIAEDDLRRRKKLS